MKQCFVYTTIFFLIIFFPKMSIAQSSNKAGHFELETDPIAYALKGYSFHAGYQVNRFRFDAGIFGVEEPKSFSLNDDFKVVSRGVGIKADFTGLKQKGWFIGAESDYSVIKATYKLNNHSENGSVLGVGIRGGYRFMFGKVGKGYKGFYISPWVGVDKLFALQKIVFAEKEYKQQGIRVFPTVHIGWRF